MAFAREMTLVEPNSHLAALAHRFLETLSALTMGAPPSPPPVGEGRVWGDSVQVRSSDHSTPSSTGIPPIPCPSPQGGGAERAVEMGGRRRPPAIVAAPLDTRLTLPPADLVIMSYVLVEQLHTWFVKT